MYARTGSYSDAARAVGAPDPSTVRKALLRVGHPRYPSSTRARSPAASRAAAAVLDDVVREGRERTRTADLRAALTLEDLLCGGENDVVRRLAAPRRPRRARARRRAATLTRRKLRAEARALERDTTPTIDQVLATGLDARAPSLRAAVTRLREARASQPASPATSATSAT